MKKLNVFQKLGIVLVFSFVAFSIGFSTYQLCFDKVDAAMYNCGDTDHCYLGSETCSGPFTPCVCGGKAIFFYCVPGNIVKEQ